jgi:hypothetical protein
MTALLAVLNTAPGASSGGTLTVSVDSDLAFALVSGAGTWETNTVTANASGGSGGYSFAWTHLSGSARPAVTAASSATTAWTVTTPGQIGSLIATWQVTVTDGSGHTGSTTVIVDFEGYL